MRVVVHARTTPHRPDGAVLGPRKHILALVPIQGNAAHDAPLHTLALLEVLQRIGAVPAEFVGLDLIVVHGAAL